jgi:hypothetical protein
MPFNQLKTPRVHHAAWRRGIGVAARGAPLQHNSYTKIWQLVAVRLKSGLWPRIRLNFFNT